jgi:adenosylmethionine-8-amino-7-oxononanoate aminotransferase
VITRGRGDHLYFGPPLVSSEAVIDHIVAAAADGVRAVLRG